MFDVILRNAGRLCRVPFGGLYLVDDARTHASLAASLGARSDYLETALTRWSLDDDASVPRAIVEGRVVHIEDIADTEGYRRGDRQRVDAVEIEGIRTFLAVPLLRDAMAIGCIGVYRREVMAFSTEQIALLETFAQQAVIAIDNVRQFRELQMRLEREAATREILQVISRSPDDVKPVLETIVRNAARLCDSPDVGLHLANEARTRSRLVCVSDADQGVFEIGQEFDLSLPHQTPTSIREGRVIHNPDIADDPLYRARDPIRVRLVEVDGVRSRLSVPLLKDGVAFGCINLNRHEVRPFTETEIALIETFAAQAVIAIENVRQFKALAARTEEVQALNASLEARVDEQVGEIERMGRLKRFLSPAVAETVVTRGEEMLSSHRALIATLFCDIRGFTAFCETAEPEETIEVLQTYHEEMGKLISSHGAGVDKRMGDGIMVILNDPLPCEDPAGDAVRLAIAMRARMQELCRGWKRLGHRLGFGVGISLGYATVGMVGSEGRYDYTASGTTVNLAARLCDKAEDGEILLSPRARMVVEDAFRTDAVGEIDFKGLREPVEVFRLAATIPTEPES
ncbi:GAF domain-containing protein [Limibaculum sp. FT325]|uniref:GAF domain-containing protein n=1 Tax=Thermohalobaculum sediminis TaxID=2939436 RepID=UPI0020BE042C|nr:GAF domain-containing protein [Limibaculum sediminis]MCL5776910.1 GAF domain-containing protein [Limibaculum sediminis]